MTCSGTTTEAAARLAFFGAVTASLSHDINNVLATIAEIAGLLDDLTAAARAPLEPARIAALNAKTTRHVQRGTRYVELLNRFAHSVDRSWGAVDAAAAVALAVGVGERAARLRDVSLVAREPTALPPLEGRPFDLLRLINGCVEAALVVAPAGAAITVGVRGQDRGCALEVGVAPVVADAAADAELRSRLGRATALTELLDGRLRWDHQPAVELCLDVVLPPVLGRRTAEEEPR